ncbi:MAG: hypothetical protein HOJ31_10285 [Anaerolineae bacterium]|jgi:hypothetical protein|nr:hypothetical protein [Anaerolineae bacterium]
MSVLSSIKTYLLAYIQTVDADAPLWVNYLRDEPVDYSIVPLGGSRKVTEWISGNSGEREFLFAFQSARFTADEAERVGSIEFFETLADWLDTQSETDTLPSMGAGLTPFKIEALEFGYLFEQGTSDTGVYQIQCRLEYEKA